MLRYIFFVKLKRAYDVRISDWSSDVCSSGSDHGCEIEAAAFDDALHFRRGKLATRRGGLAVMLPERPADVDDVILQYFPQLAHVGDQCSVAVELGQAGRTIVSISTFRRLRIFMQRVGFQLHTFAVTIMSQIGRAHV